MNFYLNCLRDVDRHIEVVLDALEASGEADRTIVVFTADHGEMAGSHGLRQKGNLPYDENTHVPMIVIHPDVAGGTRPMLWRPRSTSPRPSWPSPDWRRTPSPISTRNWVVTRWSPLWKASGPGRRPRRHRIGRDSRRIVLGALRRPRRGRRIASGDLRPDWRKRGFLRAFTDERFTFARYFSPLEPNRPKDIGLLVRAQ